MTTRKAPPVDWTSADLAAEQLERLQGAFPECVAEGKVDFEKLKAILGDIVDDRPERYSFTWAGKRDAIRLLQVPSRATLEPCPGESVDWDATKNVFIDGENLEVLKLLYKSYAGRVKMIYIDPPYNTGNDFIYPDNFADPLDTYLKLTGQKDSEGNLLTSNPETSGRYHSAWLSMMYPRLWLARQLLTEDGLILVSNDDHEAHNLRLVMDELFGGENFVAQLVWKGRQFTDSRSLTRVSTDHEYVLVYSRSDLVSMRGVQRDESKFKNPDNDPRGLWMSRSILGLATEEQRPNLHYEIVDPATGNYFSAPRSTGWRYSKKRMQDLIDSGCILFPVDPRGRPREKKFRNDLENEFSSFPSVTDDIFTAQGTAEIRELFGFQAFDFPKPSELVRRLVEQATGTNDTVLDFFAGSATTCHAVYRQNRSDGGNRKYLCVQLNEPTAQESEINRQGFFSVADIGKERIRRVIKKLKEETTGQQHLLREAETEEDLGFRVFKLSESNCRQWRGVEERDGKKYAEAMELFIDPLLPGWNPEEVVWEVALKAGYSLSSHIEDVKSIERNRVLRVTDPDIGQSFHICLDDTLEDKTVRELKLRNEDLFVCRDAALTDELAANVALQCKLKTI